MPEACCHERRSVQNLNPIRARMQTSGIYSELRDLIICSRTPLLYHACQAEDFHMLAVGGSSSTLCRLAPRKAAIAHGPCPPSNCRRWCRSWQPLLLLLSTCQLTFMFWRCISQAGASIQIGGVSSKLRSSGAVSGYCAWSACDTRRI